MTGLQGTAKRDGTAADTAYWYKLTTHCLVESHAGGRVKSVSSEPVTVHGGSIHSGEGRSIESGWLKVWRSADSESFLDVYSRPGNHFLLSSTRSFIFRKGGMDFIYYYVLIRIKKMCQVPASNCIIFSQFLGTFCTPNRVGRNNTSSSVTALGI